MYRWIYRHACIYIAYIYTYMHIRHTYTDIQMLTYTYAQSAHIHTSTCLHVHIYLYVICLNVCITVSTWMCLYLWLWSWFCIDMDNAEGLWMHLCIQSFVLIFSQLSSIFHGNRHRQASSQISFQIFQFPPLLHWLILWVNRWTVDKCDLNSVRIHSWAASKWNKSKCDLNSVKNSSK